MNLFSKLCFPFFTILNFEGILSSCRNLVTMQVKSMHSYVTFNMLFFPGFSFRASHGFGDWNPDSRKSGHKRTYAIVSGPQ